MGGKNFVCVWIKKQCPREREKQKDGERERETFRKTDRQTERQNDRNMAFHSLWLILI